MFKTRGSDWLKHPGPDRMAWVKHIRKPEDLNLDESGGYAFQCRFTNFDEAVFLQPDDFLLVAVQEDHPDADTGRPGGPARRYKFVLVSGRVFRDFDDNDVLVPVRDHDIRVSYERALQADVVPEHKVQSGRHNHVYQMAVHCYWHYYETGRTAKSNKTRPGPGPHTKPKEHIPFPGLTKKKRRIDVGLVADEAVEEPVEEVKKEPKRVKARRHPRRPPPDYRL